MTTRETLSRREALALFASVPIASALACSSAEAFRAQRAVEASRGSFVPQFFNAHELDTVRLLVDLVLPRDERSGSATDAGVPEFMDFMMEDRPEGRVAMRGGLAWLDAVCQERFDQRFVHADDAQRRALLDDIAEPGRAPEELAHGAVFFSAFRDLTATGFFTSKMGFDDLQYQGNTFLTEWTGCPEEALRHLGLTKG